MIEINYVTMVGALLFYFWNNFGWKDAIGESYKGVKYFCSF